MYELDVICENSNQNLVQVPEKVLKMCNLKMLYLEGNEIEILPENFFPNLKLLSWLDLRNNKLKRLPENIGNHQHLENLLLSNNLLVCLPNQLGLIPNLKALQIADNPLVYPHKEILSQGLRGVCKFLKEEFYKMHQPLKLEDEERELRVIEQASSQAIINKTKDERIDTREMYQQCRKSSSSDNLHPTITVKKLSKSIGPSPYNDDKIEIVHKISRDQSKISVKSHYNDNDVKRKTKSQHKIDPELKENWLSKVKLLLNEQEKILQQEKNLRALSSWRLEKKNELPRSPSGDPSIPEPPYATYPEYDSILSRSDLTKEINKFIEHNKNRPQQIDIEKMISEVVGQLKLIESNFTSLKSPRTEIQEAEKQINTVMAIHKKLQLLQTSNDASI